MEELIKNDVLDADFQSLEPQKEEKKEQAVEIEYQITDASFFEEKEKQKEYYAKNKEALNLAGILAPTNIEDMKKAVKWHRSCVKLHWVFFGWWQTMLRTFAKKGKPFKFILNALGVLLNGFLLLLIIAILNKIF